MARTLFKLIGPLLCLAVVVFPAATATPPESAAARALWADVDFKISRLQLELGFRHLSDRVRNALVEVPREQFIPEDRRAAAYANRPVPIGYGQTISQPLIVAIMSELLAVEPGDRVFELGTGSGYQAAILDAMGAQVHSVEIIPELAQRARETLDRLGHSGVQTRVGDGYFGRGVGAELNA